MYKRATESGVDGGVAGPGWGTAHEPSVGRLQEGHRQIRKKCGLVGGGEGEPTVGLEPTTCGLQNRCSAIELRRRYVRVTAWPRPRRQYSRVARAVSRIPGHRLHYNGWLAVGVSVSAKHERIRIRSRSVPVARPLPLPTTAAAPDRAGSRRCPPCRATRRPTPTRPRPAPRRH